MKPSVLFWSSGKDCALALHRTRQSKEFQVKKLLSQVFKDRESGKRVSNHGIGEDLLEAQVRRIGLPLVKVTHPVPFTPEGQDAVLREELVRLHKEEGLAAICFGDLFRDDLRALRESKVKPLGYDTHFPLWGAGTQEIAKELISLHFKIVVASVDLKRLPESFVGRMFNEDFQRDLPESVDPCGENGEFHTFVFGGPIFTEPLSIVVGKHRFEGDHAFAELSLS